MSRTNYYYDPPESENMIEEPGELCDLCSQLNVCRAGSLVPIPTSDLMKEYGVEEAHGHTECIQLYLVQLEEMIETVRRALVEHRRGY